MNRIVVGPVLALMLASVPAGALAQPMLIDTLGGPSGYGVECLSTNDDGSSNEIDITTAFPGGVEFFGRRHTTAYVNTNGNITFDASLSTFTPMPFPIANRPTIAPYWADVDIRGSACTGTGGDRGCTNPTNNGVWWHLEPGRMVVTWDRVGYFRCKDSRQMTFQLILTEALYCGVPGDFDVEFRYAQCQWETGDFSGGTDGFGGTQAQVGFDAGNLTDFVAIMGSRMAGISRVVCDESNVGDPGVWRFRIRRGVIECPDAGDACTLPGALGVCAEGRTQCRGSSVECQPIVDASPERCDAFDNDCDGMVDEDPGMCGTIDICERGRCIPPCFEGGCESGFTCSATGVCLEDACATVTCAAGERCAGGVCLGVCGGVVCPPGQNCVGGTCQNLCDVVECGACETCDAGNCRTRCEVTGCGAGEVCEETGVCVEEACYGVLCGPGRICREGLCASACDGVICPSGETCLRGECAAPVVVVPDAGVEEPDLGPMMQVDMGPPDAGRITAPPPDDGGCGCAVPGEGRGNGTGAMVALMAFGLLLVGRRRRALLPFVAALALVVTASACSTGDTPIPMVDVCGDGMLATAETCDDGNVVDGDGCASLCFVEIGFTCAGNPSRCTTVGPGVCGDRMVGGTEECDDGGESGECDADCSLVRCGDGTTNDIADEECDDGNMVDADGCSARCFTEPETCGNGMCEPGETCNNCGADCASTRLCMECADVDADGARDQACGGTDCNDEDATVRPGMTELPCNRIDEDCDRATRDAVDADMDGSTCNFDCDDANAARNPLLREICADSIDNDCDAATEDLFDSDADGARCDVDCDDYRATTCPDCDELCNNTIDDDCDPTTTDVFSAGFCALSAANATCATAAAVTTDVALLGQATAGGGPRPTGTSCGSGTGDNTLYYAVTIPAATSVDVVTTPLAGSDIVLLTEDACDATACTFRTNSAPEVTTLANTTTEPVTRVVAIHNNSATAQGSFGIAFSYFAHACGNGRIEGTETCDDGNSAGADGCSSTCGVEMLYVCASAPSVCRLAATNVSCATATEVVETRTITGEHSVDGGPRPTGTGCGASSGDDALYYLVRIPPYTRVAVQTTPSFDITLTAQDSCAAATCSFQTNTSPERTSLVNSTAAPVTRIIAVGASGATTSGTWSIAFTYAPIVCGDGAPEATEACDDGNVAAGDGCSATCTLESGYLCTGTPSVCRVVASNGFCSGATPVTATATLSGESIAAGGAPFTGTGCYGFTVPTENRASYYSVTVPPLTRVSIAVTPTDDVVLVAADSCASTTCTLYNDSDPERGTLTNTTAAPVTQIVSVRAYGATTSSGSYSIAFTYVPFVCGNGVLEGAETCDDGNTTAGDGCTATCTVQAGYSCSGAPSVCALIVCGDGLIRGTEGCDDGNTAAGDGCSAVCAQETGFACIGAPSVCVAATSNAFCATAEPITGTDTLSGESTAGGGARPSATGCGSGGGLRTLYYAVTIPAATQVVVQTTPLAGADLILFTQDSCGAATCPYSTDSEPESATLTNSGTTAVTRTIGVRGYSLGTVTYNIAFTYTAL